MERILHMAFNQDGSCFCLGTNKGFLVYNTSPIKKLRQKEFNEGIKIIEMLKKSNILALVGDIDINDKENQNESLTKNKIIIYDDIESKINSELTLDSEVLNVKLKLNKIIATTKNNYLYIIELFSLNIINVFKIYEKSKGIFALNSDDKNLILAFPYRHSGFVKIKKFNEKSIIPNINAHDNDISFLSLDKEGNLLSTTSTRGTLIRIFCTFNGELIQELRRGAKIAEIYSINFDLNKKFLGCSSNNGTVHIFSIYKSMKYLKENKIIEYESNDSNKKEDGKKKEEPKNQKSLIGSIVSVLKLGIPYFESEWSFAQFRIPKMEKTIISFSQIEENTINVLTKSGNLYQASFDLSLGGECHKFNDIDLFKQNVEKNKE